MSLYKVTELFPDKEPLKMELRQKANQILAGSILLFDKNPGGLSGEEKKKIQNQILGNIEVLKAYFEVAKGQRWVDERNFFVLEREYDKIREEIEERTLKKEKKEKKLKKPEEKIQNFSSCLREERFEKILEVLGQKERAQVKDFKKIFPQISKRTLRRDFEELVRKGIVQRTGQGKWTFYYLNRTQKDTIGQNRTLFGNK